MNYRLPILSIVALFLSACNQMPPKVILEEVQESRDFYIDSSLGIPVTYDFRSASSDVTQAMLTQFFVGFQMIDTASLRSVLADDFIWYFKEGVDANGYQIKGVNGVIENLTKRKGEWRNVKYTNNRISGTPETIFQSYTVDFDDLDGNHHSANGIDIYKIKDGKIASKDSYWKQILE